MESVRTPSQDTYYQESGGNELEKYASMLLHLNLIKRTVTYEGTTFQITESGLRYLREYQGFELALKWVG